MSSLRFKVGATVMCNMGPGGWQLGRIIASHYRENHWPAESEAPYQVALEADHTLIYVPEDNASYCRMATPEDLRIARRMDALATLPTGPGGTAAGAEPEPIGPSTATDEQLDCTSGTAQPGSPGYRRGRCHCCDCCPRSWSCAELYSEHYRCAARNGLRVTRRAIDLGTVRVGDSVHHPAGESPPSRGGFMQCPTLVRLPPGVRLEITFVVEGNEPPDGFDVDAFMRGQQQARAAASRTLNNLVDTWEQWEMHELGNRDTCDQMGAELRRLRELLERYPRLDGGRWWVQLGGFHMNVHKLLENTLFECELYLGHALTFGDAEVRRLAEQNLEGCYQKRLLEAARFMWIEGIEQMMRGEWAKAAETLRLAAAKKDGWGWAVNSGDIWLSESATRLVHGAQLAAHNGTEDREGARWVADAAQLLERGVARAAEGQTF